MFKLVKRNFCKFTSDLKFTHKYPEFKSYRVIDLEGVPVSEAHKESCPVLLNKIFDRMLMLDETDRVLYMAQR